MALNIGTGMRWKESWRSISERACVGKSPRVCKLEKKSVSHRPCFKNIVFGHVVFFWGGGKKDPPKKWLTPKPSHCGSKRNGQKCIDAFWGTTFSCTPFPSRGTIVSLKHFLCLLALLLGAQGPEKKPSLV